MANTAELIQLLGKRNLVKLQAEFGPRQMHIPARPDASHPIAQAIGPEAMEELCEEFGCTSTYIGVNYLKPERNLKILQMVLAGRTLENISQAFGLTQIYIRKLTQADTAPLFGSRARQRRAFAQGLKEIDDGRARETGNRYRGHGAPNLDA